MNFEIWGLSGSLTTERPDDLAFAEERLWLWIREFDDACNRFRPDSEISRLNAQTGTPMTVSVTMASALEAAFDAAAMTEGLCDPTVLSSLLALGYDRDYDVVADRHDIVMGATAPAPGLGAVSFDRQERTVTVSPGTQLDLGASAKALVADLVASDVASLGGVVVEIGGDVAVRGEGPEGPWAIGLSDSLRITGHEPRISFTNGGIATSSSATRTWHASGQLVNHIIDPRTGSCANSVYVTATVSAPSCLAANAFATAALLWGEDAGYHIGQAGWSGRLVRRDGSVDFVGGWPEEEELTT